MTARYAHALADAKMGAVRKLEKVLRITEPDPRRTPEGAGQKASESPKLK